MKGSFENNKTRQKLDWFPPFYKEEKEFDSKEVETFEKIYFCFKINMDYYLKKPQMPMNK